MLQEKPYKLNLTRVLQASYCMAGNFQIALISKFQKYTNDKSQFTYRKYIILIFSGSFTLKFENVLLYSNITQPHSNIAQLL